MVKDHSPHGMSRRNVMKAITFGRIAGQQAAVIGAVSLKRALRKLELTHARLKDRNITRISRMRLIATQ